MAPAKLAAARAPVHFLLQRSLQVWQELHRGRQTGGMGGLGNIGWQDLAAYQEVTRERLSAGVIEAVRVIDEEFMASCHAAEDRRAKAKPKKK